jgi:hypothetical protein
MMLSLPEVSVWRFELGFDRTDDRRSPTNLILGVSRIGGFIHGEFLGEALAVLVDYDSAEKAGKVQYPLYRNHFGIQWPGT